MYRFNTNTINTVVHRAQENNTQLDTEKQTPKTAKTIMYNKGTPRGITHS